MFKNPKFLIILLVILISGLIFSSYFIWQNNSKIIQNNQIQPLVADENHDVVVLEECDLTVRFKKAFKIEKDNNKGDEYFYLTDGQNKGLFISCSGAKIKGLSNRREFKDNDKFLTPGVKTLLNKNMDFSLSTNGVNSNECTGLAYNFQQNGKKYEIIDQIAPKPFTCAIDAFFVDGKNNFFTELFGKYGQDYIQIQFNSLAPSTPSVKLQL